VETPEMDKYPRNGTPKLVRRNDRPHACMQERTNFRIQSSPPETETARDEKESDEMIIKREK